MVKMKSYITVILFILAIILSIGGFLLDKVDKVPFILKTAAPEYSDGLEAFNKIANQGTCIKEGDTGFSTLASLTLSAMEGNVSGIKIVKICRGGYVSAMGKIESYSIMISINEEQTVQGWSYPLENLLKNNELMNRGSCIKEGDTYFSTFANLKFWGMDGNNISNVKIVKICLNGINSDLDKNVKTNNLTLAITINREQTIEWPGFELESRLTNLGERTLLKEGVWVFALGIILNISSFIIERRKDKNEKN